MTLFWAQVALMLLGTFFHCLGRMYELRHHQRRHYLDRWDKESEQALCKAIAWSLLGEHIKADEAFARLRLINRKYMLFFDSIT